MFTLSVPKKLFATAQVIFGSHFIEKSGNFNATPGTATMAQEKKLALKKRNQILWRDKNKRAM